MSRKNVTEVVWDFLIKLRSLNNTMSMVSGVSVQVSGTMKIHRTEHRKQMTKDKGQTVFCHLTSVIYYLTPDTRHLKPTYS